MKLIRNISQSAGFQGCYNAKRRQKSSFLSIFFPVVMMENSQPVDHSVMRKAHNKFIDHSINARSPNNKLRSSIIRVVEYEVIRVELR